jgi:oligosaccharide reducing-end xylanase
LSPIIYGLLNSITSIAFLDNVTRRTIEISLGRIYDYKAWADKILTAIVHHPLKRGPTKYGPRTVHNMVNEEARMIRFVPDSGSWGFSDPSYHLPAFYDLWAKWGPESDKSLWAAAADTSRNFFQKATNPKTGLAPDYANFDGTPHAARFNQRSGNFSFDARRTQMNWAVDWSWWSKDPREQEPREQEPPEQEPPTEEEMNRFFQIHNGLTEW